MYPVDSESETAGGSVFAILFLRAAPITSGANLLRRCVRPWFRGSGDFVILPKGIWALHRVQFSSVLWPEKRVTYFSGPKSYPQLRTFKGYRTTVRGSENWTIFLDTFFAFFFASKSQFFFMPHVISRKLDSNYTLASARPLLAGIV